LGCGGGSSVAEPSGPPSAPTLSVPGTGVVGFQVTASVQGANGAYAYSWTISAPATFKGGTDTATGNSVAFTYTSTGPVTLTCVAIAGNAVMSPASQATVTFSEPSIAAGMFVPAGSLLQPRQGLAAAMLSNGSILVTGGAATPGGPGVNTTEIYTPSTESSAVGPNMTTARSGHAAVQLSATQYLVVGGTKLANLANSPNAEVYFSGGLFTPTAGALASVHLGPTATLLANNTGVLVAGGLNGLGAPVNTEELYTISTQSFASAGTLALAPNHTATALSTGKVLLVSHTGSGSNWVPFATVYDPVAATFSPTTNQPSFPREGHQALVVGSQVLILGGNGGSGPITSAEWYNPVSGLFSPVPAAMASPRQSFGAAILLDGTVLLLGGTADGTTAVATAEIFDPVAVTFTPAGNLGTARIGPTVFVLPGGNVLVLGGTNALGAVTAVEAFEPS
jgi:hypothetical protein